MTVMPIVVGVLFGAVAPASLADFAAAHQLTLVYRGAGVEADAAVAPLLGAFAAEYGPDGLGVAIAGAALAAPAGVVRLEAAALDPRESPVPPALAVYAPDGAIRLALPRDALDLFAGDRLCETALRGRDRASYAGHVRDLLERHRAGGTPLVAEGGGPTIAVVEVLANAGGPVLFLPPGCTSCLLAKYAAALDAALAAGAAPPLLAFEAAAAGALRDRGWRGSVYLLPLDAAARILQLRQGGVYAPLLVSLQPDRGIAVAPLNPPAKDH